VAAVTLPAGVINRASEEAADSHDVSVVVNELLSRTSNKTAAAAAAVRPVASDEIIVLQSSGSFGRADTATGNKIGMCTSPLTRYLRYRESVQYPLQ